MTEPLADLILYHIVSGDVKVVPGDSKYGKDYTLEKSLVGTANSLAIFDAFTRRQAAYTSEADPLFFMSQRGEATVEEWQAKVAEIKARYPYPEETQA
jgi:hypothetical protein